MITGSAKGPVDSGGSVYPEEQIKRRLHPLDSYPRLWECAVANRPPDTDDQFRFRWFGLFYQAPVQDAFTVRLRLPGGRLKPHQLAGLAHITQQHAGGAAVLNAQGGLDLPGVPVAAATEILQGIESIGLSARQTGGDCVQSVRGGESDGLFADQRRAPIYPLVCALEQALAHSHACSNLPRACEIDFRMFRETPVVRQDGPIDSIILQVSDQPFAPGDEPRPPQAAKFALLTPGDLEWGYLLPCSRVVAACLELLKAWAAGADRTTRDSASLPAFISRLEPDGMCALLRGARRVRMEPPFGIKTAPAKTYPSPGFAVPGGRLLSSHLSALDQCCRKEGWREVRLWRGHLVAVGTTGQEQDASAAMGKVMSLH